MIDNYLSFAKRQRLNALVRARQAMKDERLDHSEICRGIDAGLRIAYDLESRHWRTLQKDIEAFNSEHQGSRLDFIQSAAFDKLWQ